MSVSIEGKQPPHPHMPSHIGFKKPGKPIVSNTVFIPAQKLNASSSTTAMSLNTTDRVHISTQSTQLKPTIKFMKGATHEKIQFALKKSLKDGSINAHEASNLRSLLLDLPRTERQAYQPQFMNVPMTKYASHIILDIDVDMTKYAKDFSKEDLLLIDSQSFKRVFPNFNFLSLSDKQRVVSELKPFLQHFPTVLDKLTQIKNSHLGSGFQFYFLTKELDKELGGIIPEIASGVIMPGANVVKNPLLHTVLSPLGSLPFFDKGGLYTYGIKYGVFAHEMAHVIHINMLNDDQRDTITNLYDNAWNQHNNSEGKKGFISRYGQTNAFEYFAESLEAFLVDDKTRLKAKDPEMYAFLEKLFAEGKIHNGKDGNLFTDPEKIGYVSSFQGGKVLHGVSISRDSNLAALKHLEASSPSEIAVMGGDNSVLVKGSVGLKASWKPWTKPFGVYGTFGATAQGGVFNGKPSIGAGGYVGAGVDYKFINVEARHNFMGGVNTPTHNTEIRASIRFEF